MSTTAVGTLFPPIGEEEMGEKLRELVSRSPQALPSAAPLRRSPQALGYDRSRQALQLLREHLGEEAPETDAGT